MTSGELRSMTKGFAIDTIKFVKTLPESFVGKIIGGQLLRAGTSMAANYRAACRGRSKKEFFSKISIVVEETDETMFWLEILIESEIADNLKAKELLDRSTEFIKIFSSTRKTISNQLSNDKNFKSGI